MAPQPPFEDDSSCSSIYTHNDENRFSKYVFSALGNMYTGREQIPDDQSSFSKYAYSNQADSVTDCHVDGSSAPNSDEPDEPRHGLQNDFMDGASISQCTYECNDSSRRDRAVGINTNMQPTVALSKGLFMVDCRPELTTCTTAATNYRVQNDFMDGASISQCTYECDDSSRTDCAAGINSNMQPTAALSKGLFMVDCLPKLTTTTVTNYRVQNDFMDGASISQCTYECDDSSRRDCAAGINTNMQLTAALSKGLFMVDCLPEPTTTTAANHRVQNDFMDGASVSQCTYECDDSSRRDHAVGINTNLQPTAAPSKGLFMVDCRPKLTTTTTTKRSQTTRPLASVSLLWKSVVAKSHSINFRGMIHVLQDPTTTDDEACSMSHDSGQSSPSKQGNGKKWFLNSAINRTESLTSKPKHPLSATKKKWKSFCLRGPKHSLSATKKTWKSFSLSGPKHPLSTTKKKWKSFSLGGSKTNVDNDTKKKWRMFSFSLSKTKVEKDTSVWC